MNIKKLDNIQRKTLKFTSKSTENEVCFKTSLESSFIEEVKILFHGY